MSMIGACPTCGARPNKPKVVPTTPLGKRRAELGLSLQNVANLAGITKTQVWEIERKGGHANPKMATLLRLAQALHWPLETLVEQLTEQAFSQALARAREEQSND